MNKKDTGLWLIRLPKTFADSILPKFSTGAQCLLLHLVQHSNKTFKPACPGVARLSRLLNCSVDTVKRYRKELKEAGVIGFHFDSKTNRSNYFFNLQEFQNADVKAGYCSESSWVKEAVVDEIVQTTIEKLASLMFTHLKNGGEFFACEDLPSELKKYKGHLHLVGRRGSIYHMRATSQVSPQFVEEQFRKNGLKILVKKSA